MVADLHSSSEYENILRLVKGTNPDLIIIPGDLVHCSYSTKIGMKFLSGAAHIAPVFYSFGNHERFLNDGDFDIPGVTVLNSKTSEFCGVIFSGLRSGFLGQYETSFTVTPEPDIDFLDNFEKISTSKVLICHHPEYYDPYISKRNIDLTVSGHAHGGQWSIFGRGVFAPGQGLFPKYTHGFHYDRFIISRGASNTVPIPRFFNPTEIVLIDIIAKR